MYIAIYNAQFPAGACFLQVLGGLIGVVLKKSHLTSRKEIY